MFAVDFLIDSIGEFSADRLSDCVAAVCEEFGKEASFAVIQGHLDHAVVAMTLKKFLPLGEDGEWPGAQNLQGKFPRLDSCVGQLLFRDVVEILGLAADTVRVVVRRFRRIDEIEAEHIFIVPMANTERVSVIGAAFDEFTAQEDFIIRVLDFLPNSGNKLTISRCRGGTCFDPNSRSNFVLLSLCLLVFTNFV